MNKLTAIEHFRDPAAGRRAPATILVCAWRRDPATGALVCRWTARARGDGVPLSLAA